MSTWGQYITSGYHVRRQENFISPANITFTDEKLKALYKAREDLKQIFPKERDFLNYYKLVR